MLTISKVEKRRFEKDIERFIKKDKKEVKHRIHQATLATERMAKMKAPVDQGDLRQGIYNKMADRGLTGAVISKQEYSLFVEEGTRPHGVYSGWFEGWVKRRLKPGRKRVKSVAFLVARKIASKGTEPQPFLFPAWNKAYRDLMKGLKRIYK